jgi:hypothetical protein
MASGFRFANCTGEKAYEGIGGTRAVASFGLLKADELGVIAQMCRRRGTLQQIVSFVSSFAFIRVHSRLFS